MCFSPTASFTAAIVLAAIGLAALKKAKDIKVMPLAALPVLLGLHQFMEGIVWITFDQPELQKIFSYLFLITATAMWPIWVPASLYILEKGERKKWLKWAFWVGVTSALLSVYHIMRDGSETALSCNHIAYSYISNSSSILGGFVFLGYLYAVAGSFFMSTLRYAPWVGAALGAGLIVTLIFYLNAFGSVWCFFGALSSILVYFMVRSVK